MSYDPVESAASGTVKGALDWTEEKVKTFIEKFRNRQLVFIQDQETIKLVKEQYNSGELNIYKIYIEDKKLLFLVKLGLTLRKLGNNRSRKQNLRDKIFQKYDTTGLHVAQFAENGILNRYISILIDNLTSIEDFKRRIKKTLEDIDKYVIFVKADDTERFIVDIARTKVFANTPSIFIVSGMSHAAEIVRKCELVLTPLFKDYTLEKVSSGEKENLFYKRAIR